MGEALEMAGYSILPNTSLGDPFGQTRTRIRKAVADALRQECETLVVYFSAHGLHYRGHDYIVPAEFDFTSEDSLEDSLILLDFGSQVDQSPAQNIIFVIDACREGVDFISSDTKGYSYRGWGAAKKLRLAERRNLAYIYACGAGQFAQFVDAGLDSFSIFTKGLSEAIQLAAGKTLHEIQQLAQDRVNTILRTHNKQAQDIRILYESATPNTSSIILIPSVKPNSADISWQVVLQPASIYANLVNFSVELREVLREVLLHLQRNLKTTSPWQDSDLPLRALRQASDLLTRHSQNEHFHLNEVESMYFLAACFIRESVLVSVATKIRNRLMSREPNLRIELSISAERLWAATIDRLDQEPQFELGRIVSGSPRVKQGMR